MVWELRASGLTIDDIVETLKPKEGIRISHGTVHRDLKSKQKEIEKNFQNYIEKELPMQHNLAVTGLERVIKEAWRIYSTTNDEKTMLTALSTIATATMQKQAVLGDPAQIEMAIKTVAALRSRLGDQDKQTGNREQTTNKQQEFVSSEEAANA